MTSRSADSDPTQKPTDGNADPTSVLELALLQNETVVTYVLPRTGALILGRSAEADIQIDDGAISRAHARVFVGSEIEIEDLGSANGTWMRGLRLEPHARVRWTTGEVLRLGSWSVLLRAKREGSNVPSSKPLSLVPIASESRGALREVALTLPSAAMRSLSTLVLQVAKGDIAVLVLGETGVGKEITARLLHANSPRSKGPFVVVNCPAISENLLESELFGHDRGAFTGALSTKVGLLESAHEGTVFLDEVGELPLTLQAKLLRVLEDKQITRVGSKSPKSVDVRFVAATNRDLELEVAEGRFRRDLFYRLDGARLWVPPLRERPEDIEPLATFFLKQTDGRSESKTSLALSRDALAALCSHSWPGNVRELRNVLGRAALVCGAGPIQVSHLTLRSAAPSQVGSQTLPPPSSMRSPRDVEPVVSSRPTEHQPLKGAMREMERERILAALNACAGNQTKAAKMLGISRRALVDKLSQHDIPRPRKT
ncbi:MAG: sigma 54-interacting transcriptional regulator [Polyangiaceae bacterium]|nr:sigma 54-interacting transcriptional regulator [Polyangiaceae bacterium]